MFCLDIQGVVEFILATQGCKRNNFETFSFISAKEKTPIKVTLRDGKIVDGLAWKTTPYEVAASIR